MPAASAARRAACWAVHVYTATGALAALGALVATTRGSLEIAFGLLAVAVVVDATDGTFARAARVKEVVPHFDGSKLDDIVDYLTFVLVPIFVMLQIGLLAGPLGWIAAGAAVLASAIRFCRADAKTVQHFFTGFPSYWNIVAFYFFLYDAPPSLCGVIILVLAALVLAPLRFIYPSRTPRLRGWSIGLGCVWALMIIVVILRLPERSLGLATISLAYPAYYTLASFYLDWDDRQQARQAT